MDKKFLAPEMLHRYFAKDAPLLGYRNDMTWKAEARSRLTTLLFGDRIPQYIDPLPTFEKISDTQYQISFWSEPNSLVIARLSLPAEGVKMPLMICLQGHTLNTEKKSVGISSLFGEGTPEDIAYYSGRGINTAQQAAEAGYAVLAVEQRGFGERSDQRDRETEAHYGGRCHNPAMASMIYGRSVIGSRVHDVSTAITVLSDLVSTQEIPVDLARIACVGHSGGGTIACYAGALDDRITAVMASGSICQFDQSIAAIDHCICNYVPNVRTWFEMGDIGAMIAPRPFIVVHGVRDPNFPIKGVRDAVKTIKDAYADQHIGPKQTLVEGDGVHEFFPKEAWPAFRRVTGW